MLKLTLLTSILFLLITTYASEHSIILTTHLNCTGSIFKIAYKSKSGSIKIDFGDGKIIKKKETELNCDSIGLFEFRGILLRDTIKVYCPDIFFLPA